MRTTFLLQTLIVFIILQTAAGFAPLPSHGFGFPRRGQHAAMLVRAEKEKHSGHVAYAKLAVVARHLLELTKVLIPISVVFISSAVTKFVNVVDKRLGESTETFNMTINKQAENFITTINKQAGDFNMSFIFLGVLLIMAQARTKVVRILYATDICRGLTKGVLQDD